MFCHLVTYFQTVRWFMILISNKVALQDCENKNDLEFVAALINEFTKMCMSAFVINLQNLFPNYLVLGL